MPPKFAGMPRSGLPDASRIWFAALRLLANNVDWSEAEWGNKTYLEPLLDADEPLGELARVVLCLGLSAKEPGEHTLAADVLAAAITDGRVDGQILSPTLAKLLTTGDIKPARWAKVFGDVARISPLHAHIVRLTLENTLAEAGKRSPIRPRTCITCWSCCWNCSPNPAPP